MTTQSPSSTTDTTPSEGKRLGMPAVLLTIATMALGAGTGCSSSEKVGCASNSECPAAHVCQSKKCEKLCDTDVDCSAGTFCTNGTVCEAGNRDAPQIATVSGGSANQTCSTGGISSPCMGGGFVVQGENLGGSTFRLLTDASDVTSGYATTFGRRNENTVVDLLPTLALGTALPEGEYTLYVMNAAGTDQTALTLLQGERGVQGLQGEPGANGSAGQAGERGPEGPAGPAGGSAFIYENAYGTVQAPVAAQGDRAIYRVAEGESTRVMAPDMAALCGDPDGCLVSIGARGFGYAGAGGVDGSYWGPACQMFYNAATGGWSLSQACNTNTTNSASTGYTSWWVEQDGAGSSKILAAIDGACYFAEEGPGTARNTFVTPDAPGFVFHAAPTSWQTSLPSWGECANDGCPTKTCEMIIRD